MSILDSLIEQGMEKAAAFAVSAIPAQVLQVLDNDTLLKVLDEVTETLHKVDNTSPEEKRKALAERIAEECAELGLTSRMINLVTELIYNRFRLRLEL